jgi:hypothetical protein
MDATHASLRFFRSLDCFHIFPVTVAESLPSLAGERDGLERLDKISRRLDLTLFCVQIEA